MSGIYTLTFDKVSVTAVQDLFAIVAHASKQCVLLGFEIGVAGVAADAGDAQEEMLALRIRSGQTTAGSGGSAPTPVPVDASLAAAGFTARVNDTTQASAGTIVTHWTGAINNRVGIDKPLTDGQQIIFGAGRRLTIELIDAPTDALTVSGTAWVQEIG
jgi:hypothetical protein